MDEAFLDLQKAMTQFSQDKNITELKITQHDPNASPVILVGMSHPSITDMAELRRVAENYIRNELYKMALQSPNADEKMLKFAVECFPRLVAERIPQEEKTQHNTGVKMKLQRNTSKQPCEV
jgi:altronate dehydratase